MLKLNNSLFNDKLFLTKRINKDNFKKEKMMYFDNDGFELTELEKDFYRSNNVILSNCLNHEADQKIWFSCSDENFYLDHSLLLQRWEMTDDAKEQIKENSFIPQSKKYLKLRKKWGLDFALEYNKEEEIIEVLHIENDYSELDNALNAKENLEKKILSTDWYCFVNKLINKKEKWSCLSVMKQNDWKAKYWGLNQAEITIKAFG